MITHRHRDSNRPLRLLALDDNYGHFVDLRDNGTCKVMLRDVIRAHDEDEIEIVREIGQRAPAYDAPWVAWKVGV